jgi:hypothetical protein
MDPSQIRAMVERFRSVHLDTLAEIIAGGRDDVEKTICDLIISDQLDGYKIDGDWVVRLSDYQVTDARKFREIFLTRINVLANTVPV